MDKIDLTKHAEAILTAAGYSRLAPHCPNNEALLTACAALADDAARAMREAADNAAHTEWFTGNRHRYASQVGPEIQTAIRAIDPATLRDS